MAQAPPVTGTWSGDLATPAGTLKLNLHIFDEQGSLRAKLDSVTQGAMSLAVDEITLQEGTLRFAMRTLGASFEGKISADGSAIEGSFSQGGANLPLKFVRGGAPPLTRPQEPKPPFPYRALEVSFENAAAMVTLAGTLTLPTGQPPFPAIILLTGSGPQDRDESIMGHKPFLVIADHLTRQGFAVLRYDDRGFAKSTGSFAAATSQDFAADAEAAFDFLRRRPEVDPRRIGFLGHSEGGILAPMVAARRPEVAFLVLLAPTGVTGQEVILAQTIAIGKAAGAPQTTIDQTHAEQQKIFAAIQDEPDPAKLAERLSGLLPPGPQGDAQLRQLTSPWLRYFLTYDPAPALEKTKCPVLVLNGELDLQVLPQQNLPRIEAALKKGGNSRYRIERLAGLNHLFQPAKTGHPVEYPSIETTIDPAVLELMTGWLREQTGPATGQSR